MFQAVIAGNAQANIKRRRRFPTARESPDGAGHHHDSIGGSGGKPYPPRLCATGRNAGVDACRARSTRPELGLDTVSAADIGEWLQAASAAPWNATALGDRTEE
jgi:hypothetical protein